MSMTPKSSFFRSEGRVIGLVLWATGFVFVAIMVATWIGAERARPVLLDLETGKPVAKRPAL